MTMFEILQMNFSYLYDKILKLNNLTLSLSFNSIKNSLDIITQSFEENLHEITLEQISELKDWIKICVYQICQIEVENLQMAHVIEEINQNILTLLMNIQNNLDSRNNQNEYALCICDAQGFILNKDSQFNKYFQGQFIKFFDLIDAQLNDSQNVVCFTDTIKDVIIEFYHFQNEKILNETQQNYQIVKSNQTHFKYRAIIKMINMKFTEQQEEIQKKEESIAQTLFIVQIQQFKIEQSSELDYLKQYQLSRNKEQQ